MNIKLLTNQITYNRLLRASAKILKENVFEFNDDYTRNVISQKFKALYSNAKNFAIKDYRYQIMPFDPARPHFVEVRVAIQFNYMIEYVYINVNNVD